MIRARWNPSILILLLSFQIVLKTNICCLVWIILNCSWNNGVKSVWCAAAEPVAYRRLSQLADAEGRDDRHGSLDEVSDVSRLRQEAGYLEDERNGTLTHVRSHIALNLRNLLSSWTTETSPAVNPSRATRKSTYPDPCLLSDST